VAEETEKQRSLKANPAVAASKRGVETCKSALREA
jgi:hypothetical protein